MLILEIEYLAGVAFAAVGPDSDQPDWPPQPDRIFSALVATWAAAHGQDDDEAEALEWLEALPPPVIQASPALQRTAPDVFVPPNDPRSDKQKHAKGVLPTFRSRQPRRFPAARPDDPVVRLYWDEAWLSEATSTCCSGWRATPRTSGTPPAWPAVGSGAKAMATGPRGCRRWRRNGVFMLDAWRSCGSGSTPATARRRAHR